VTGDRHSVAEVQELITEPEAKARREAENGVRRYNLAVEIIREHVQDSQRPFRLRSRYLQLNAAALGYSPPCGEVPQHSGQDRKKPTYSSRHVPCPRGSRASTSDNWVTKDPLHLSAYVLWRINWIHPFADGNGRTARMLSRERMVCCPDHPRSPNRSQRTKTPII
jgi:hypothetical protein